MHVHCIHDTSPQAPLLASRCPARGRSALPGRSRTAPATRDQTRQTRPNRGRARLSRACNVRRRRREQTELHLPSPWLSGSRPGRTNQAKSGSRAAPGRVVSPSCVCGSGHRAPLPPFRSRSHAPFGWSASLDRRQGPGQPQPCGLRGSAGVPIADGRAVGSCWPNKISGIRIQMLIMTPCKTMETETCPNRTMYMQVCVCVVSQTGTGG